MQFSLLNLYTLSHLTFPAGCPAGAEAMYLLLTDFLILRRADMADSLTLTLRITSIIDFLKNGKTFFLKNCMKNHLFSIASIYFPVYDFSFSATSSGVPQATTVPPLSPPSGPMSMI